jgi:hypothetical protein
VVAAVLAAALVMANPTPAPALTVGQAIPAPDAHNFLGVGCDTGTLCVAGGSSSTTGLGVFAVVTPSRVGSAADAGLSSVKGVACFDSGGTCVLVGASGPNGALAVVAGGNVQPAQVVSDAHELNGVACVGSTCVAVGDNSTAGVIVPIVNGVAGTAVDVNPVTRLDAVACQSATACVAVGQLVEVKQQGVSFSAAVVPINNGVAGVTNYPSGPTELTGVACGPAGTCGAVGAPLGPGTSAFVPIANGQAGTAVPVNSISTLYGITCPGVTTCYAVGQDQTPTGFVVPIVGGSPGQRVPISGIGAPEGIACPRAADCEVVGEATNNEAVVASLDVVRDSATSISSSANPAEVGQSVTYTAKVIPVTGVGTVSFFDNGSAISACQSRPIDGSGAATCTTTLNSTASRDIVATYSGDSVYSGSSSPPLLETVTTQASTTTVVSPGTSTVGSPATFTATVTARSTPAGTVTFSDGSTTLGTRTLDGSGSATLTTSNLALGFHTINVAYGGSSTVAPSSGSAFVNIVVRAPGPYHPLAPTRILDTRSGSQVGSASTVPAFGDVTTTVTGTFASPDGGASVTVPDDASAVVMNVAEVNGTSAGNATLYPVGQTLPNTANLNWAGGQTVSNLVEVAIGNGGQVTLHNASASPIDVIYDLAGYVEGPANGGAGFYFPQVPVRLADTRGGGFHVGTTAGPMASGTPLNVVVAGTPPFPSTGVAAVALNVTVTEQTGAGHLTIYPPGSAEPTVANLNYRPGEDIGNRVIVAVGPDGSIDINNFTLDSGGNPGGTVQVVVDAVGWFSDATVAPNSGGTIFTALTPVRAVDTRNPQRVNDPTTLGDFSTITVHLAGANGVPSNARAVALNVAVTNTTQPSNLRVFPSNQPPPNAADINWLPGVTRSNLVLARLGSDGSINIENYQGKVDVIVDVLGFYT